MEKLPLINRQYFWNRYFHPDQMFEPDGLTLTSEAQQNIATLLDLVGDEVSIHEIVDFLLESNQTWLDVAKEEGEDNEATEEDRKSSQKEFDEYMETREALLNLKAVITKHAGPDPKLDENHRKLAREYWLMSHTYTDDFGVCVTLPGRPTKAEITAALEEARKAAESN